MRLAVPFFFLLAHLAEAVQPPIAERAIRARAEKFYSLLVAHQYRQSEPFVIPTDRDLYYAMEKPLIYDYQIKNVTFAKDHKTATLDMESLTKVRRPMVGEMKIHLSYPSYWKLENGTWFLYIPTTESRDTPFGKMVFSKKGLGAEDEATIKKKIADGSAATAVFGGVKVASNSVSLGDKIGDTASFTLENTLPGRVVLVLNDPKIPFFTLKLSPSDLGGGERATLVITRTAVGILQPIPLHVKVQPTQQEIVLQVK